MLAGCFMWGIYMYIYVWDDGQLERMDLFRTQEQD